MNRMASLFACTLALMLTPPAVAVERIVEWVEDAPIEDTTKVALGYPTPIPVETPLPFDGFRTYAGLHTRHQDLAATSDYVHAVEIGTTRAGRVVWAYRLGDADPGAERGWFFANTAFSEEQLPGYRSFR
jgi:hypothetical protein